MDLHDNQGILNNGTVYMQADNIDLKPWISRWLHNNTGLDNAEFSLAAWLSIKMVKFTGAMCCSVRAGKLDGGQ